MLLQLIGIQFITFIAIVFVLRKLLYTETAREAVRLKKLRDELVRNEKELQLKIDAANNVYKEKMEKAEADIRALRLKAEEDLKLKAEKAAAQSKADADHLIKTVFNAKEKMREEISVEMRRRLPELASQMLSSVLSDGVKEAAHKELVSGIVERIKKMSPPTSGIKADKGEIESACQLSRDEMTSMLSVLAEKFGRPISLTEKVNPSLMAGVVVRVGILVIDGSMLNRMRQIEEKLVV